MNVCLLIRWRCTENRGHGATILHYKCTAMFLDKMDGQEGQTVVAAVYVWCPGIFKFSGQTGQVRPAASSNLAASLADHIVDRLYAWAHKCYPFASKTQKGRESGRLCLNTWR